MRLNKYTGFKGVQFVILGMLFVGTMNLGNLYFYFMFGASLFALFVNFRSLKADRMVVMLLALSFLYIIFDPYARTSMTSILKQFLFPMCYLMGLNFIRNETALYEETKNERQIMAAIVVCASGAFMHYLLNMSINFNSLSRSNVDYWTGNFLTATGQACLAVLALAVFIAWLFDSGNKKIYGIVGLVLILAYNMVLAGRTLILVAVILSGVALWYSTRIIQFKVRGKFFFFGCMVVLIFLVAYVENLAGIRDFILGSNFSSRFENMDISQDTRVSIKMEYLKHALEYPMGGGNLRNITGSYAHELYLDVYNDAGLMAYLVVILFAGSSFYFAFKTAFRGIVSGDLKILILCVYLAIFIVFLLEPIIRGMPWLFCTFCFYSGLIKNIHTKEAPKTVRRYR